MNNIQIVNNKNKYCLFTSSLSQKSNQMWETVEIILVLNLMHLKASWKDLKENEKHDKTKMIGILYMDLIITDVNH